MSDTGSQTTSGGITFFGLWQVINFVLYFEVDAPWNKVQHWPFWSWLNVESVMFPTVLALTIAVVVLVIMVIVGVVVAVFSNG